MLRVAPRDGVARENEHMHPGLRNGVGGLILSMASSAAAGDWVGFGVMAEGCDGAVQAGLTLPDGRWMVGGSFTVCGQAAARGLAIYDPRADRWSALPGGVEGAVQALALIGDTLYVGGRFARAGGIMATDLAAYSLQSGQWRALGVPASGGIAALAAQGTNLYVGGTAFGAPGLPVAVNVARYRSDENRWETLGSGVNGAVSALAVRGDEVYVGGLFDAAGGAPATHLARYRGATGTWSRLGVIDGNGFAYVSALALDGSRLHVGGRFRQIEGRPAVNIAAYDVVREVWEDLPPVGFDSQGASSVQALRVDGPRLLVGGSFFEDQLVEAGVLAFDRNEGQWRSLDAGFGGSVQVLLSGEAGLLAAGAFERFRGGSAQNVLRRRDGDWQATESGGPAGLRGTAQVLAADGADLLVAGQLDGIGGTTAAGIVRREAAGGRWQPLGAGLTRDFGPATVTALLTTPSAVYAVGDFTRAGTVAARALARFDRTSGQWSGLGATFLGTPLSLVQVGDELYVAGGLLPCDRCFGTGLIARYHLPSGQWRDPALLSLGRTVPVVRALVADQGLLYVAGRFYATNNVVSGPSFEDIAVLDTATGQWRGLAGSGSPPVGPTALVVHDGSLYVGHQGGVDRYHLAEQRWERFLSADGPILKLRMIGASLGVVGEFRVLAGQPVNGVAMVDLRDGRISLLGPAGDRGVIGVPSDLATAGARLYLAGRLSGAGGIASRSLIAWDLDRVRVTELYNRRFNHYFITAEPAEVEQILSDPVLSQEWSTTGASFSAWRAGFSGAAAVCRFRGSSIALNTNSSHFYTRQPAECAGLIAGTPPGWTHEREAFAVAAPTGSGCATGTQPVYRSYNRRIAAESHNHRYTTSAEVHQQMLSRGHADEGVAFCVPLPFEASSPP